MYRNGNGIKVKKKDLCADFVMLIGYSERLERYKENNSTRVVV